MNRADRQEAAAMLRALLAAVDRGEVTADGPVGVAVVRRLEGALLALEAMEGPSERAEPTSLGS